MTGPSTTRRTVDTRSLPVYRAGDVVMPYVITGMAERVERETAWAPHSHPTHELLWNRAGASTATIGSRTWTITPSVGLWIPAGLLHSARAPAGTWYRTAHVDPRTTFPLPAEPVAVEVTPLLTLLLGRLVEQTLGAHSRELTEQMVFDLLEPSPHALLVQRPDAELLRPIVAALEAHPGDGRSLTDWAGRLGVSERTVTRGAPSSDHPNPGNRSASTLNRRPHPHLRIRAIWRAQHHCGGTSNKYLPVAKDEACWRTDVD